MMTWLALHLPTFEAYKSRNITNYMLQDQTAIIDEVFEDYEACVKTTVSRVKLCLYISYCDCDNVVTICELCIGVPVCNTSKAVP